MNTKSHDKAGRPRSDEETADIVKGIRFRPSDAQRLENMRRKTATPVATFIKRVVDEALDKFESGNDDSLSLPIITSDATGEFATIIQSAERIAVGDLGKLLRTKIGDFLVKLPNHDGHVAGISFETVFLMRPYRDPDKQTCLIGILGSDDIIRYIICKWIALESGAFELRDTKNNLVELPKDAQEVYPVAVQRAQITIQDEGKLRIILKERPAPRKGSKRAKDYFSKNAIIPIDTDEDLQKFVKYYKTIVVPTEPSSKK